VVARAALCRDERAAMLAILDRHFDGVEAAQFDADLAEKNWVILLEREDGQLAGFSTLLLYSTEHEGEDLTIVYSGDTIVDRDSWGSTALPRTWIQSVLGLSASLGAQKVLWLLIVSGFRTYRFLPLFFDSFFPRCDGAPAAQAALAARLAHERFGARYCPARGTVRLARPQRLKPGLVELPEGRQRNPHVAFFARANPRHAAGEELVCLTELSQSNMTRAGRRMLGWGAT
jgi:hypothetical protein